MNRISILMKDMALVYTDVMHVACGKMKREDEMKTYCMLLSSRVSHERSCTKLAKLSHIPVAGSFSQSRNLTCSTL